MVDFSAIRDGQVCCGLLDAPLKKIMEK